MKTVTNISTMALAALTLMLTGCTKEELIGDSNQNVNAKEIGVYAQVVGGATTRAAVTGTTLPAGSHFGLYAYKGTGIYTDTRSVSNIKVNNSGAIQDGAIYWPTSAFTSTPITFYAYYPYQENFGTDITEITNHASGYPELKWVTPTTPNVDLMFAKSTSYTAIPTSPTKGVASFTFNHILSHFDVQAKLVDITVANNQTLSVTKVELKGIDLNGTFSGSGTGSWTSTGSPGTRTITETISLTRNAAAFESVSDFLILPQPNTGRTITVTYLLNGASKTLDIPTANIPTLEIGKKHILEITFSVSDTSVAISFNPVTVVAWGTGSGTSVTEPQEV